MYFLYIKVLDISYKEDIILGLQSVGVVKASVIESKNLENELSSEMSLFRGFFRSEEDRKDQQIIINAVIDDKDQAKNLLNNLGESGIDLAKDEILRLFVIPVSLFFDSEHGLKEW